MVVPADLLRMRDRPDTGNDAAIATAVSWPVLRRAGLLALAVTFALSTQLLFQFDLYADWPLPSILLGWLDHFMDQLIVGICIFAAVAAAFSVPVRRAGGRHLLILVAIALGALAGEVLLPALTRLPPAPSAAGMFAKVVRWEVVAGLSYLFFIFQRQGAEAAARLHDSEVQRIQMDRQMTEAQLDSLRAQIEPHFLFNTLANIQRLYQTEPSRGRRMLASFVAYVRAALPQLRGKETTLAEESALARAYLDVLQVRMAERLRIRFDIPDELGTLRFPPLALATLTENAIKHGLNPLPEGGAIEISARIDAERLEVSVVDTGVGLQKSSGTGAGLANLRARLAALYGNAAQLRLDANTPRGIRATIVMPVRPAGSGPH